MPLHTAPSALLLLIVFLACRSPAATSPTATANACASGVEVGRAVVSGAQLGQGTTVAFAVPEGRIPSAIALLTLLADGETLVACGLITTPVPTSPREAGVEVAIEPVGDASPNGLAQLSPGEGRYEGRLQIKVTTQSADPFVPYWLILIAQ